MIMNLIRIPKNVFYIKYCEDSQYYIEKQLIDNIVHQEHKFYQDLRVNNIRYVRVTKREVKIELFTKTLKGGYIRYSIPKVCLDNENIFIDVSLAIQYKELDTLSNLLTLVYGKVIGIKKFMEYANLSSLLYVYRSAVRADGCIIDDKITGRLINLLLSHDIMYYTGKETKLNNKHNIFEYKGD